MTKFVWVVIVVLIIIGAFAFRETLTNSSGIDSNNSFPVATQDSGEQVKLDEIDKINTRIQNLQGLIPKLNDEELKVCKSVISNGQVTLDQYKSQMEAFKTCINWYASKIDSIHNEINSLEQQRATIISGL